MAQINTNLNKFFIKDIETTSTKSENSENNVSLVGSVKFEKKFHEISLKRFSEIYHGKGLIRNNVIPLLAFPFTPIKDQECRFVMIEDNLVLIDEEKICGYSQDSFDKLKNPLTRVTKKNPFPSDSIAGQLFQRILDPLSSKDLAFKKFDIETIKNELSRMIAESSLKFRELDCEVIPYGTFLNKNFSAHQSPLKPTPHQDVLVACGTYYDVRYAVEIIPKTVLDIEFERLHAQNILDFRTGEISVAEQKKLGKETFNAVLPFATPFSLVSTIKYHLSQALVHHKKLHVYSKEDQTPLVQHNCFETRMKIYENVAKDYKGYQDIIASRYDISQFDKEMYYSYITALDSMRPYLRKIGIFDIDEMKKYSSQLVDSIHYLNTLKVNSKQNDDVCLDITIGLLEKKIGKLQSSLKENSVKTHVEKENTKISKKEERSYLIKEAVVWAFENKSDMFGKDHMCLYLPKIGHPFVASIDLHSSDSSVIKASLSIENTQSLETLEHVLEAETFLQSSFHDRGINHG